MFDVRNELHEFVAENREEAIAQAKSFFGVDEDALQIGTLPAGEVYGLGGRALIVAGTKGRVVTGSDSSGGGGRDRDRGRDRGDRGGRDRDRGDRGGRGRDRDRDRGRGRGPGRERGDSDRSPEPASAPLALTDEPTVGTARGTLGPNGQFLLGVIERLDLGPFEVGENEEGELVVCDVKGAAALALAGGDGRAVDALLLLVNQAAMQREEGAKRVVIDVEGNTEAREEFLERLAQRVVRRAREGGRAVALDPMNGRDRRIIHLAVREHDGMATMSIGEGRYRQVVVVPEGADEYDDAVRQTEAAQQGA